MFGALGRVESNIVKRRSVMRDIAFLGLVALTLSFIAANANAVTVKRCAAEQLCSLGEGRAAYVAEFSPSPSTGFHGRGAERGQSMYIHDQQDEAYMGRFP
jgi:hypothetical protein